MFAIISLCCTACDREHSGREIIEYSGDYRVFAGIGEFFDCGEQINYYVAKSGIHAELAAKYSALGLPEKEDVYTKVEGYLKEEPQMEGIDPITLFVPTKFISFDQTRGCQRGRKKGQ
ncbi:MAG: hypothetical protein ABFR19_05525 [Pseudomonadota bacterium]